MFERNRRIIVHVAVFSTYRYNAVRTIDCADQNLQLTGISTCRRYDHFDTISEGEAVTVLAEQNGYAYVNASGRTGWCSARLLTSCTPLIASMPRMDSTHWVLVLSLRNSGLYEACFSGGSYVGYNASGCCVSGKYSLEGRRLTVDGIRFLWNGGEFVSTELQEMSGTWDHYKLIPGHTQFC